MSEMHYVGETLQAKWPNMREGGETLKADGRKITLSRFKRLTCSEDREYAETFAKLVTKGFKPQVAEYRSGKYGSRRAVIMLYRGRGWVFAEPHKKVPRPVEAPVAG